MAIDACAAGATPNQLADLADAVDALTDGVLGAAISLARGAMVSYPKATGSLRPDDRRQTLDEIRAAFADYREKRQSKSEAPPRR
jgi:hypothetical protein